MRLLAITLLTISLNSSDNWSYLKPITSYKPTDYRVNSNISYMELRKYQRFSKSGDYRSVPYDSASYKKVLKIGKIPKLSSNQLKKFNASIGDFGDVSNIRKDGMCLFSGCSYSIINAFTIDKKGKTWRLNEVKDIINSIKPIDTPAEIRLVIWLHYIKFDKSKVRYKKTKIGFNILLEYENSLDNIGECGKFGYKFTILNSGKVTKMHRLYKVKIKNCITMD